jgi:hypothetical protein
MADPFDVALDKLFQPSSTPYAGDGSKVTHDGLYNGVPIKARWMGDQLRPESDGSMTKVCMCEVRDTQVMGIARDSFIEILNVIYRITGVLPTYDGTTMLEISREQ